MLQKLGPDKLRLNAPLGQTKNGPFRVPLCLCFKASLSPNHSYENDFDLHENETACRIHFHMKGFALRLVLKWGHKGTRKWPIYIRPSTHLLFSGRRAICSDVATARPLLE